ncbi:MAG: arginase family protein, partial [Micromonosporaceae bacterium]
MRRIAVIDAPSNLGLRPPSPGTVPGCAKAPGALRDHGLVVRLGASDAGCVVPPRYDPEGWRPGDGVCQAEEIADYTMRLAARIGKITERGDFPLVLGGDCSIVLGAGLAMRRRRAAEGGRYGLIFIDGHSDFRHSGNAEYIGAAAGEDLALVTGRGQGELTNIDDLRPYLREEDVVVLGIREHDEYRMDLRAAGIVFRTVPQIRAEGPGRSAAWAIEELGRVDGFWVHVDVDVLDPAAMPAVDAPDPGGIAFVELEQMIADLVTRPACLGMEVTVFDPDYDPDGRYAEDVVDTLVGGLRPIWELSQPELSSGADPEPELATDSRPEPEPEPEPDARPGPGARGSDTAAEQDGGSESQRRPRRPQSP